MNYGTSDPATELAQALGLKPNTLSTYIGALMRGTPSATC